jgi:hypothetical protein
MTPNCFTTLERGQLPAALTTEIFGLARMTKGATGAILRSACGRRVREVGVMASTAQV